MKETLDNFDSVELHNGEDIASCHKSKHTGDYFFVFNCKGMFALKSFKSFEKRVNEYIVKYNLIEREDES